MAGIHGENEFGPSIFRSSPHFYRFLPKQVGKTAEKTGFGAPAARMIGMDGQRRPLPCTSRKKPGELILPGKSEQSGFWGLLKSAINLPNG